MSVVVKVINWPCPREQGTVNEAGGRQTQKHGREKAEEKVACGTRAWRGKEKAVSMLRRQPGETPDLQRGRVCGLRAGRR